MDWANGANGIPEITNSSPLDPSTILHVLENVHNRNISNEQRLHYSSWLEKIKGRDDAAAQGFALAQIRDCGPLIRHFGLSLLEHVVRHSTHSLSEDQSKELRHCVIQLGLDIQEVDPAFIRNKVAEVWIELIKRTWALEWYDVDEQLVGLWAKSLVHQTLVLTILENLSDDVFVRDDPISVLRGRDLSSGLVEVFTSTENYTGGLKVGDTTLRMRCGEEGWLNRITQLLNTTNSPEIVSKCLATFRSVFTWIMTPAIANAKCLPATCNCLTKSNPDIIVIAIDTLLSLYSRTKLEEVEVQGLVYPLCQPDSTSLLRQVYVWSVVGADEIDSIKYTISKKMSWLVHSLADCIIRHPPPDVATLDLTVFLEFIINIAEHASPIVSVSALHSWAKLLEAPPPAATAAMTSCVGPLLQVTSGRLFQYEQLPEDTTEPAIAFVNEEIELFPERQGFYTNYRKFCSSIVELICLGYLEEALGFILSGVSKSLEGIVRDESQFDPAKYTKTTLNALTADAQFSIIEAAFRGLVRWLVNHADNQTLELSDSGQNLKNQARDWSLNMLKGVQFKDPQIKHRQIKTAVDLSSRIFQKDAGFALVVLEHILSSLAPTHHQNTAFAEANIELNTYATNELRRLALHHADYFITFYDHLQTKFNALTTQLDADEKLQVDLKSILFLIIQRAQSIDIAERQSRLWNFLSPVFSAWKGQALQDALANFESFTKYQRFDQVLPYLISIQANSAAEWTTLNLDERGADIQKQMGESFMQMPFRETRILLSISTERLEQDTPLHGMICDLWVPMIQTIIDAVLRFTTYNHRLHDPSSWPHSQPNMYDVVQRLLRDRYWQSGISEGTISDFHAKIKTSKATLEGFASSVRGRIRNNLEQCYSIIHTLGRLGARFYSLQQIPEMISEALIRTASPLSPHHFTVLLQMLPKLIEECAPEHRSNFLTPIQAVLLEQMDQKLTQEWASLEQKTNTTHNDENLNDEMRDDSVLRQTTHKAVNLVLSWLDQSREQKLLNKRSIVNGVYLSVDHPSQSMSDFVFSNIRIMEPVLLFCCHAIAYKDSKSCHSLMTGIYQFIPAYTSNDYLPEPQAALVREFCCSEILKTAISCLHDSYYVDNQQHYAELIARIWIAYGLTRHVAASETEPAYDRPALTQTARSVLLSLPGMTEAKVDDAANRLTKEGYNAKPRKLRAVILSLLEDVRGVRISELGKFDNRQQASKIMEKYKQREALGMQGMMDDSGNRNTDGNNGGVDLAGVADMFG